MIIFRGPTEDNQGINFEPLENSRVVVKMIDGYTGLCSYSEFMEVSKGFRYFLSHPVKVYHRRFEIWNSEETLLYLKIDLLDDFATNLEKLDIYGSLKEFKYKNKKDKDPALPLYEIFCTGIYNRGERCQVKEEDVVFDIGGNLGIFSYYSICSGASEVHCFEPSPGSYNSIVNNFKFDNLFVEECAVTSYDGEIEFYNNDNNSINSSAHVNNEGSNKILCRCINLQNYINSKKIDRIDYLKIDCEGAEYEIIETLDEEFLSTSVRNMCIEYHLNSDGRIFPMIEKLEKCGFEIEFEHNPEQINYEMGIFYAYRK